MELLLTRKDFTNESTIGELFIDEVHECFVIEDKDRGLTQKDSLETIKKVKVFAETCIPYGKYEIGISFSNRFQQPMPILLGVPGWEGVRIHWGNKAKDTEGCLIVGTTKGTDFVGNSKYEYSFLLDKLKKALEKEKVFLTINK